MFTGRKKNIVQWIGHPNFQLMIHDVVEPIFLEVDQIYHLACPASPPHYQVEKKIYIFFFFYTPYFLVNIHVCITMKLYVFFVCVLVYVVIV